MKYSYLRDWARSCGLVARQVENARKNEDGVTLRLTGGVDLVFVFSGREAFAYTAACSAITSAEFWPQLKHARIESVEMDPADRIMYIHLRNKDIYQQVRVYRLIAEFTPPRPNLILAREEAGNLIIEDALSKYGLADNPQRQVLPRLVYQAPQTAFRAVDEPLAYPLQVLPADGRPVEPAQDMNSYLILYHDKVLRLSARIERQKVLTAKWMKERRRCAEKLNKQRAELAQARQMEHWLACAEAIKYNLGSIHNGDTELITTNYLDPALAEIKVPLSADRSPRENMEAYLKKYRKARNGLAVIEGKIRETEQALERINATISRIEAGDDPSEPNLHTGGNTALGASGGIQDKLLRLRISAEYEIVIGRKARENDMVTTQMARPHDWWFHTRIYHGGHVLLRCLAKKDPDEELVRVCCGLAAWYSKARFSANVPVDFTQVRYVRKPRRSAPGFVTYTTHQTVFADPLDLRTAKAKLGL